jgi:sigma-B regulation protein RsbU (phosphoserine phosphatase)
VRLEQVTLASGDVLVLYTDGVTEAMSTDGDQWTLEGLSEVVRANHGLAPEELVQKILQGLNQFANAAPLTDDVTLVVTKVA